MMDETTVLNDEQTETTQPEDNGQQSDRRYTKAEVSEIVKSRLERERARAAKPSPEMLQRIADLEARENRVACREYIAERGFPLEMLEVIDTSNAEEFMLKAEKMYEAMERAHAQNVQAAPMYTSEAPPVDPLAQAFGRDVKHIPNDPSRTRNA